MTLLSRRFGLALVAGLLIAVALAVLERERAGLRLSDMPLGTTPATLIAGAGAGGPVVVVAHGFAGSRQIMQGYTLRLAQAGYRVLAFDFEGHGRNPVPMSGDVTSVTGTTALLVAETRRAIAAARALPGRPEVALLGHSMATDIIIRAAAEEAEAGSPVAAVVAVSMFSGAVTETEPPRLLAISGQWEGRLRQEALRALHQVDPAAAEGEVARAGGTERQAVVAPWVGHVGVLYSPTAVQAARGWLDAAFGRAGAAMPPPGPMGLWILALLAAIVVAFRPLAAALPVRAAVPEPGPVSARRFAVAVLVPALAVPAVLAPLYQGFLPVMVADYLMLHLALYGALQLAILRRLPRWPGGAGLVAVAAVVVWGLGLFGLALDRYAASFWPAGDRLAIIAILCLGTVPFMLADAHVTGAGRGALWRRIVARLALFVSLGVAGAVNPAELMFVLIVLPVFLLFFLVHGLMGRWVAQRAGATAAGLGLGLCLGWALGVSFPLFSP